MALTALPEPPADLASLSLLIRPFRRPWFRMYRLAHSPLYFGRSGDNRFDAPAGEFGVLYVGRDTHATFIETLGRATGVRVVVEKEIRDRGVARMSLRDPSPAPLRMVDLTGEGLKRIGLDARLGTGDYPLAQRWSRAIHDHPRAPDGLVYRSRNDPKRKCAAVFERAGEKIAFEPLGSLMEAGNVPLLGELLDTYEIGLV